MLGQNLPLACCARSTGHWNSASPPFPLGSSGQPLVPGPFGQRSGRWPELHRLPRQQAAHASRSVQRLDLDHVRQPVKMEVVARPVRNEQLALH